jgi:DNA-binding CsgD family transcriptional regulator
MTIFNSATVKVQWEETMKLVDAKRSEPMTELHMASLKQRFGLTPAESRLALRLVTGEPLRSSAAALGVGYETARTTLKAIFSKTGTCRQTELVIVIMLATLPPG